MKKIATILACALVLQGGASAFELGAGISYDNATEKASPLTALYLGVTESADLAATYTNNADRQSVIGAFSWTMPLPDKTFPLQVFVQGGASMNWFEDDFENWSPSLVFGAGVAGDVLGMTGRALWLREREGGGVESKSLFTAGLFLSR